MDAIVHDITGRVKEHEMFYARPEDFALGGSLPVNPAVLFAESGWSPYCIDHAKGVLAFVKLPAEIDLAEAPFLYVTQYRHATKMMMLPLAQLEGLTANLPDPALILVFSMGRCGTTLASHAINGSSLAWSLSEPETFNHRALQLPPDSPVSGGTMVRAIVRLLFALRAQREKTTVAIKLRSQSLYHIRPFIEGRPDARYVFMYRDAISWSDSVHQFLIDVNFKLPMDAEGQKRGWDFFAGDGPISGLARYVDLPANLVAADLMLAAGWMAHLESYLGHLKAGVPFLALRYNDFVADRRTEVARLFAFCGLPGDGIDKALTAFDEDSQKDTVIGRRENRVRLTPENIANIRMTLAKNPAFADPDLILPDVTGRLPRSI